MHFKHTYFLVRYHSSSPENVESSEEDGPQIYLHFAQYITFCTLEISHLQVRYIV